MKILKNAGDFKVLACWPSEETNKNAQMILEKAGRTCYQSEKGEITPESAQKFITNCCKRTHYSVIEHGWRGYKFLNTSLSTVLDFWWPQTKFLYITKNENYFIISANLETWRKLYFSNKLDFIIRDDLEKIAPAIFTEKDKTSLILTSSLIQPITSIEQLQTDEEKLTHVAHTVQYNNHSRGFTHELVRHRLPVYSQESTRYVDESDFEIIVPPHKDENECIGFRMGTTFCEKTSQGLFGLIEEMYKTLRNMKWRPEDARQILPTAIKAQIVMSCNLKTRRYIYYRRTSSFAHWEIRRTMCNELKQLQETFPQLFTMFEYQDKCAKDAISGYYEITCSPEIFLNE
jgi:thymidylate synthase ThyX